MVNTPTSPDAVQQLSAFDRIVNDDGTPTPLFLRQWLIAMAQKQGFDDINSFIASLDQQLQSVSQDVQTLMARKILAGAGLTGGGDLTADRTLSLNAMLDQLNDVDVSTTPPTDGQALAYDAASSLWKPKTISGGGGGINFSGYATSSRVTTNNWAYPTKGELVTPPFDVNIGVLAAWVSWNSSITYRWAVFEVSSGTVVDVLYLSNTFTTNTVSGDRKYHKLPTPVTLISGKTYGIALTGDDGTGNYTLPLWTAGRFESHLTEKSALFYVRMSTPTPQVNDTVETGVGNFAVEYMWAMA